eukprot:CAMPEP_0119060298 /NCGR_PEP_ID=MMETSP1178-20130426/4297_1 /TAXON_ID=33656 /ORGANISM="unid sp, Strain CCMP2000" /LENGTH=197 /DNA_ID=CAMNT_0007041391 /DNA_START=258 /DNA_END=847 /DNA_ORIENTATION=+
MSFVYQKQSSASDSSDGKSWCASFTLNRPALSQRLRHSGLATGSSSTEERSSSASRSRNRKSAAAWFCICERESLAEPLRPVGLCLSTTAVCTLLRCCPPGPEPLVWVTAHSRCSSSGGIVAGCGGCTSLGSSKPKLQCGGVERAYIRVHANLSSTGRWTITPSSTTGREIKPRNSISPPLEGVSESPACSTRAPPT